MEAIEIIRAQVAAYDQHMEHAVVTIVHSDGAARSHGKMLVYGDGATKGTVGGGAVERLAIRDALECIREGGSAFRTYDLNSPAAEAGMACGGCTSVLIEAYAGRPLLVMCGGGHVGGAVLRLAGFVGFDTLLLDDREEGEKPPRRGGLSGSGTLRRISWRSPSPPDRISSSLPTATLRTAPPWRGPGQAGVLRGHDRQRQESGRPLRASAGEGRGAGGAGPGVHAGGPGSGR